MTRHAFDGFVADSADGLLRTAYLIVGDRLCGFVLIVVRLAILQWSVLGTPALIVRARDSLRVMRDRLRRREVVHKFSSDSAVTAEASVVTRGHKWMTMGLDTEDRLAALEHNQSALRDWHQHKTSDLDQHVRAVERELGNVRAAVYRHEERQEAERKDELRSTLRWELGGVALFLSGTVLSVLESV